MVSMAYLRMIFLVAFGVSVVLWVATWWRTGPLDVLRQSDPPSALTFSPTGQLFIVNGNGGLTDPIQAAWIDTAYR